MRFAQAWRRRGMRAAAVTFVVPGAVAVAVATVLLGGGLRGLGAVGQVVTGPQVPEAAVRAAASTTRRAPAQLPTVPAAPRPSFVPGAAAGGGLAGANVPSAGGPVAAVPPRRTTPVVPAPGSAAGGAPSSPPPAAPPSEDIVHATGRGVAEQVGRAPAPAGPAGHDAIMTVLALIPPLPVEQPRAAPPAAP